MLLIVQVTGSDLQYSGYLHRAVGGARTGKTGGSHRYYVVCIIGEMVEYVEIEDRTIVVYD